MALRVGGGGRLECLPALIKFDLAKVRDYCRVKGEKRRHHTLQLRPVDALQLHVQERNETSSARPSGRVLRVEPPWRHSAGEPLDSILPQSPQGSDKDPLQESPQSNQSCLGGEWGEP